MSEALLQLIADKIPDNTVGDVTPEDVRDVLIAIIADIPDIYPYQFIAASGQLSQVLPNSAGTVYFALPLVAGEPCNVLFQVRSAVTSLLQVHAGSNILNVGTDVALTSFSVPTLEAVVLSGAGGDGVLNYNWTESPGATNYNVVISPYPDFSGGNTITPVAGLSTIISSPNGVTKYAKVVATAPGYNDSPASNVLSETPQAGIVNKTIYYMALDDNIQPSVAEIKASGLTISIVPGSDFSIVYPNTEAKTWLMAEPSSEPAKTRSVTPDGIEQFGDGGTFQTGNIDEDLRIYMSNYPTMSNIAFPFNKPA